MSNISYLIIYNSHNGETIKIPKPVRFHNLASFKNFLSETFLIESIDNIFLLTSFGIKLNFNLINELNDIYVFDKRFFSVNIDKSILDNYLTRNEEIVKPKPSLLGDQELNIKNITSNLKINNGWSKALLQDCVLIEEKIKVLIKQINTIFKSLNIIFQFATNFINEIEKNFNNYFSYIKLLNFKTLHKSWSDHFSKLKKFPIFEVSKAEICLVDFLNYEELRSCAEYIETNLSVIVDKFNDMRSTINVVNDEKLNVDKQIESLRNESMDAFKDLNSTNTLNEIQNLTKLLSNDLDKLLTNTPVNLELIYKAHQYEYSPKIYNYSIELFNFFNSLKDFKLKLFNESLKIFNNIANLQMKMVNVKNDLKVLTNPNDNQDKLSFNTINRIKQSEDYLSLTIDLPLLFGFMLIEKRRQFEWYDFYSKGIVSNVSEQITTIIDNEKLFRKIWLKKFGNFLSLLSNHPLTTSLPNIDITLINNKEEKFNIIDNLNVERDDILNYIKILESSNSSKNFIDLLNKNFKDLIKSTNNMKKITKVISSLSSFASISNEEKSKIIQKEEEDVEYDLNLIKGLKSQIKKLENLLHQQQYKNLSNWPVTRSNAPSTTDNRISLIIDKPIITNPPKTNPTSLLLRRATSSSSKKSPSQSNVLDASTIDKHLDNIRLKKENAELINENHILASVNKSNAELIEKLKNDIDTLKKLNESDKQEFETQLVKKDEEIEAIKLDNKLDSKEIQNLNKKVSHRDDQIAELQSNLTRFSELYTNTSKEISELNKTIDLLRNELNDANDMKNDLLSNMSSKEIEIIKERNTFESEIKSLQLKLDEVTEDYENLMELTETKHKNNDLLINDLNNIIITLLNDIKRLIENNYEFFLEFCFVLESMGLLLLKDNNEFKITRVKGLRSKKTNNDTDDTSEIFSDKPTSKVIDDVYASMQWISEVNTINSILPDDTVKSISSEEETNKFNEQSLKLISIFNNNLKSENSNFEKFLHIISFKDSGQVQEENEQSSKFFLNAISKRFKDVEGFAKKQTKENKTRVQEINKLVAKLSSKISINQFQINDLLLFLPTRIDRVNETDESFQPWAAFNIGAPHYFLKIDNIDSFKGKDWMVGRVTDIEEHVVNEENIDNKESNPFQLSLGVVWYLVTANEENLY